jgi:hypothetical protein
MNGSGEEVRLFIQPTEIMELKRNFSKGKLEDYGNSDYYLFAFLGVYGSLFMYVIIYSGLYNSIFYTFLGLLIFIFSFYAISYIMLWVPPHHVPIELVKLMMMPELKSLKREYRFKLNSKQITHPKNWELSIISDIISIKIEYICLNEWSFRNFEPENNIIDLNLNGDKNLIKEILKHLINVNPEPWKIIREKEFETKFNISISKVKKDWDYLVS